MKKVVVMITMILMSFSLTGCTLFETLSGLSKDKPTSYADINELESGKAYVWHDESVDNISEDLTSIPDYDVFFNCITGDINFKGEELAEVYEYPRSIWVDEEMDEQIPTVTSEDKLIYISEKEVPDSIVFERFADYGYTIGISNMVADGGDHYYIVYADVEEDDYKYYIDMNSDAADLTEFTSITKLYLDKVGETKVDGENVSDGGTVLGLKKGEAYTCEFYTGTYYQDFKLCANIHSFGSFERFVSYDYEFLHSNCIAITIPDYFVSGYYYVNGVGLFRYVTDEDLDTYNGEAYDENIDWNDPMILYDENGFEIYDPSDPETEEEIVDEDSDPGEEDYEIEGTTEGEEDVNAGTD